MKGPPGPSWALECDWSREMFPTHPRGVFRILCLPKENASSHYLVRLGRLIVFGLVVGPQRIRAFVFLCDGVLCCVVFFRSVLLFCVLISCFFVVLCCSMLVLIVSA